MWPSPTLWRITVSHVTKIPGLLSVRAANAMRVFTLFTAISAVVGLLAVVVLDRGGDRAGLSTHGAETDAAQSRAAVQPAVQVPARDSGVPDADAALRGRDRTTEEPTPTF